MEHRGVQRDGVGQVLLRLDHFHHERLPDGHVAAVHDSQKQAQEDNVPDLDGTVHRLSDIIGGKYALIDLWASWCGPCIATSRSMIPVYEEFRDRGFTVCGVAAEIDNTDQMRARIEKEKFPWINLVELDHKNHIWDKYGVSNSGGGTFLMDNEGTILAINPDAEKVREILSEKLKQTF